MPTLRRLLQLIAVVPGAELVLERLAEILGLTRATVARYVEILEALFLAHRLPAWSRRSTNTAKHPKCYLTGNGLAEVLAGLSPERLLAPHGPDHLGHCWRTFVLAELFRQQG